MLGFAYFTSSIKLFSQVPIKTILYGKLIEFVVQINVFYVDWKKTEALIYVERIDKNELLNSLCITKYI